MVTRNSLSATSSGIQSSGDMILDCSGMFFGFEGDQIEREFVIPSTIERLRLPDFLILGLELYKEQEEESGKTYIDIADSLVGRGLLTSRGSADSALRALTARRMVDFVDVPAINGMTFRIIKIENESVKQLFDRINAHLID